MSGVRLKLRPPHQSNAYHALHSYLLSFAPALVDQIEEIQHSATSQVMKSHELIVLICM